MATWIKQCGICDDEYDINNKKPAMLPCGHSYCQPCLRQVEISSCGKNCPFCRSVWSKEVDDLPVCYQLMPEKTTDSLTRSRHQEDDDKNICEDHTFLFSFWCMTCEARACKMCIIDTHKNCNFVLLEDANVSKKNGFCHAFVDLKDKMSAKGDVMKSFLEKNGESIASVQKFAKVLKKLESKLTTQQKDMAKDVAKFETDFQYMQEQTKSDELDIQ